MTGPLERSYRRLGSRYLVRALFVQQQTLYAVIVLMIAGLSAYVEMSLGEFVRLSLVACGFQLLYSLLSLPLERRLSRPVAEWLEGGRREEGAATAWRAAASLPWELIKGSFFSFPPSLVWLFYLLGSLYVAWELDLPAYSALLLYVGAVVMILYAASLRYFSVERVMRPVLRDVASSLPEGTGPGAPGLSLRARLLAVLPAINVITAVAADVFAGGDRDLADLAVVVLVATAVAATFSLILTLLLAGSISEPIGELREATRRLGRGELSTRVPVLTTDETGDLARSFNEMAAGLEERERIREAFGTYVDREVAEHILSEGTALEGEEVEVTLMFIDVRDFTGFAERAEAREVVASLNRLFELIVPIIHRRGGHVDKFVGDGLLAVFGAPRRLDDHAHRALASALEIADRVDDELKDDLRIGIGLNAGRVVAGNLGGAGRFDFSVIGDAVNVAARVEAATRMTGDVILVAEDVERLLRDRGHQLEERPNVPLKGKQQQVKLFAPPVGGDNEGEEP